LSIVQDTTNTYLASGSDVGCSSVILWDTNNWIAKCKMQAHTAAVTSILDLNDYQTIVSGSYDKKINVYNFKKSSLLYNLPNNKSSVTGIIGNVDKSKIMSCGLDNTLYVWNVHRDKLVFFSFN
jgi:WD40 repeat protein